VFDEGSWSFRGDWKILEANDGRGQKVKQSVYAEKKGAEAEIVFIGTGVAVTGNWFRDGGKADVFVDGNLHRLIDTYYFFAGQQHVETIWHVTGLKPGEHKVRLVVKGEKRPESEGTRIYITGATVFKTAPKKSDNFKFSFE